MAFVTRRLTSLLRARCLIGVAIPWYRLIESFAGAPKGAMTNADTAYGAVAEKYLERSKDVVC